MTGRHLSDGLKTQIPHFVYDTRSWKVADGIEFGREVVRQTYKLGLPREGSEHWYSTDIWLVGPLLFARNSGTEHSLLREARHLSTNPGHYLKLQIFDEPGGVFFDGDASEALEARAVHLIDQSRPYRQDLPSGRNWTVFIPNALLEYRPGIAAYIRFAAGSPAGRFLSDSTKALFDQLPGLTIGDAAAVAGAYTALLKALLDWRLLVHVGDDIRDVRLNVARRYIEANLHDPDLCPDDILAKVGASRATVFRDFAPLGGIEGYIRQRRLDRAYRALSVSAPQRGIVATVADTSGFRSTAELSRSFQRCYGRSPTDVVGQWFSAEAVEKVETGRERDGLIASLRSIYSWSDQEVSGRRHQSL